jgi:hypothetical protein
MRIRADSALISSALFTLALLNLVPEGLLYFSSGTDKVALARFDAGVRAQLQTWHYYGVASLAITLIALIVVWTWYIKRARSAWFVMFVVTWAWAFPLFAWPYLRGPKVFTLPEWIFNAIYEPGHPRTAAQLVLTFSAMVIALLLPIKSFFFVRKESAPVHTLSLRLVGRSAATVLLIVIAVFVWIHAQVYELTPEQLNFWQVLPAPPPPPPRRESSTVDQSELAKIRGFHAVVGVSQ